jgi:hypothetical protein
MNQKIIFPAILCLTLIFSSCNRSEREIYKLVPDNASVVATFSPGKLMKKADVTDLEFMKEATEDNEFNKFLFENPGISGIDVNAYSCVFLFGTEQKYLGVIMPIKSKKVFEKFLDKMGKEYKSEFIIETTEKFSYSIYGSSVLAWNKSLLIHLTQIKGFDGSPVDGKLNELFSLEDEKCILSEKDFKSFLSEKKDLNIWLTSNQISSLTESNMGIFNMFGAINNNYAHLFLEFQDGAVVLSSNLMLNPDFKKNFDKFNIIDLDAEKEILKMIPAEDLILAGNFRLNPDKILDILNLINSGDTKFLEDIQKETGKTSENILKSIQGSFAFSINGVTPIESDQNNPDTACLTHENIPVIVVAMQLNNDEIFNDLLNAVNQKEPIIEKNGYYVIRAENVPFYMGVKNNVILLTNVEKHISDILSSGKVEDNLFSRDISGEMINNPICLYLNLDRDSYSDKVKNYLDEEMNKNFAKGMRSFGASLKSLTLTGNIEKTELRIELKDKSVNSLHAILKSMDH